MNAIAQPLVFDDEPDTFTFDQLSDDAKARARQRYLESEPYDYDWWDCTYADADTIAEMMGITISRRDYKTMGGQRRSSPKIFFSGFACQGDGACLEGYWSPVDHPGHMVRKVRAYASRDRALHKIALAFGKVSRDSEHFEGVHTNITHTGRHYHSRSVEIETSIEMPDDYDDWHEVKQAAFHAMTKGAADRIEDEIKDALTSFMDWIYDRLEAQWDAMHEDDYVDEHLSNQDTLFDEDGDEI